MQAIYPTIVIALVNSHRTFDHMYSKNASLPRISHDANPQHTTTIQFAQLNHATSTGTTPQQVEKSNNIPGAEA